MAAARLTALDGATGWLNSGPLTAASLDGQVVLVNFWTYTCINWIRTMPYVRSWAEHYRDRGLVVVGVHSPEFGFEHDLGNVRRAARDLRVGYPIAVDNDFRVWRGFDNHYWPALYFVDAHGVLRHSHFGENDYDQSEAVIRKLLAESGRAVPGRAPVAPPAGIELPADWATLHSPETYLGYERAENYSADPARLTLNDWALTGDWKIGPQHARLNVAGGTIRFRFQARDLHLVMGPPSPGEPVRFRVSVDGRPPGAAHGLDVDDQGAGTVTEQRLYQLIRRRDPVTAQTFEITFLDPGPEAYVFTFG
jgi:thiol-disulfide isomerase/thioredoxin